MFLLQKKCVKNKHYNYVNVKFWIQQLGILQAKGRVWQRKLGMAGTAVQTNSRQRKRNQKRRLPENSDIKERKRFFQNQQTICNSPTPSLSAVFYRKGVSNIRQRQFGLNLSAGISGCHAPICGTVSRWQDSVPLQGIRLRRYVNASGIHKNISIYQKSTC